MKLERRGDRVERAGQLHDVPTWLRRTIPDIDTTGPAGENRDLAVGVAWALHEVLTLRQLLAYNVDRVLLESVVADPNALPEELRAIDRKGTIRAVSAEDTLTNEAFLNEHGVTLLAR